jgi:hypothetical protein
MDSVQINNLLDRHKEYLILSGTEELGDYSLGFIHGLEYALAMHERRPVMYVNKDRTYSRYDKEKFPEYFL